VSRRCGYQKVTDILDNPESIWDKCEKESRYNRYVGVPIRIQYKDEQTRLDDYAIFTNTYQSPQVHVYEGFDLRTGTGGAYGVDFIYDPLSQGLGWFQMKSDHPQGWYKVELISERKYNALRKLWKIQEIQES